MTLHISITDRIFIAGASGMVGGAIKRNFINAGYGDMKFGGQILTPSRNELNLANLNELIDWFKNNKPNIVIIAAAKVGGIYANNAKPSDFILENLKIQTNIIETSFLFGVKRLLFLGSSCIYPKYAEQPIKEESLLTGSLESTNQWYAVAKIAGIKLCQSLRIQEGLDAISLMPTNLYGPGDNYNLKSSHVIAALIRKFYEAKDNNQKEVICWGTGNPLREFLHVYDLAEAVRFVLERWNPPYKLINDRGEEECFYLNVGTGKDITIKDLVQKISTIIGFKGTVSWDIKKPDGTPRKQLDISKLRRLGWEPKISLEEGLKQTINAFKLEIKANKCRL